MRRWPGKSFEGWGVVGWVEEEIFMVSAVSGLASREDLVWSGHATRSLSPLCDETIQQLIMNFNSVS